jgi:hypothetical protein
MIKQYTHKVKVLSEYKKVPDVSDSSAECLKDPELRASLLKMIKTKLEFMQSQMTQADHSDFNSAQQNQEMMTIYSESNGKCSVCGEEMSSALKLRNHLMSKHRFRPIDGRLLSLPDTSIGELCHIRHKCYWHRVMSYFSLSCNSHFLLCTIPSLDCTKNAAFMGDLKWAEMIKTLCFNCGTGDIGTMIAWLTSNRFMKTLLTESGFFEADIAAVHYNDHSLGTIFEALFYLCWLCCPMKSLQIVKRVVLMSGYPLYEEVAREWVPDDSIHFVSRTYLKDMSFEATPPTKFPWCRGNRFNNPTMLTLYVTEKTLQQYGFECKDKLPNDVKAECEKTQRDLAATALHLRLRVDTLQEQLESASMSEQERMAGIGEHEQAPLAEAYTMWGVGANGDFSDLEIKCSFTGLHLTQ